MADSFQVKALPEVDQHAIRKGKCPWCLSHLADLGHCDQCPDCLDTFYGPTTYRSDPDYQREERDERERAASFFTESKDRD